MPKAIVGFATEPRRATDMKTRTMRNAVVAFALAAGACVGELGEGTAGPGGPTAQGAPDATPGSGADGLSWPARFDGQPSRLRRLTRDELVATIQALVGAAPQRSDLPPEARSGSGPLLMGGVAFGEQELQTLQVQMSQLSDAVAPKVLGQSACTAKDQAQRDCLSRWAVSFAAKALRRSPRPGESDAYGKLLATADGTPDNDATAVGAVLNAIFYSPSFLYRTEMGTPTADKPAIQALGPNEIATRLSYLSTLGPPDGALLAAAGAGTLSDGQGRVNEFRRLVRTDLGKHALTVFVLEWLEANEPQIQEKSARYLSGLPSDFESKIRASAEAAIGTALLGGSGARLADLLSTRSYLDDPPILLVTQTATTALGVTGDTDDTGREGILMHPQVLSAHTKNDGFSPFQLGRFMRENLLCQVVGAPPANAASQALPDLPPGATMRDNFQHRVSAGADCTSCHAQFSPFGFALLPMDPIGRWLKQDPSGKPYDLTGTVPTYSGDLSFSSPRDLAKKLGASAQVHGCFAENALEWALGRRLVDEDRRMVVALNDVVKATDGDVMAIFEAIVKDAAFATAVASR